MIKLNAADINYIYNMFVEPYHKQLGKYEDFFSYLQKYNTKKWKWEGKDFPRVIALLEFKDYVEKYGLHAKKLLSFNGENDPELGYLPYDCGIDYKYDKKTESNDLHVWNPPVYDFDFCLLNQTLEHVYDPILCLQNIHRHLLPNSYIWISVPVVSTPHEVPSYFFTGFSPTGLLATLFTSGFKIIECGWWGNKQYLNLLYEVGWVDYTKLDTPLKNDPRFAVITWALAKKIL